MEITDWSFFSERGYVMDIRKTRQVRWRGIYENQRRRHRAFVEEQNKEGNLALA